MAEEYTFLADYYDILGEHLDYTKYAAFAHRHNKKSGEGTSGIALDLACGTGDMAINLSELGYDTIGTDISPDMLEVSREKAEKEKKNILFLCQDMRELDLYGTVDLVSCTLDSLNYLTNGADLERVFALVHNFLEPGGIFVFDVNTKRKFTEVYGENSYVFEEEGVFCAWQNSFNPKTLKCEFLLSIFTEDEDGKWTRQDEYHVEKCHTQRSISDKLKKCGFEILGKYADFNDTPASEMDMRHFYVVKAIKKRFTNNSLQIAVYK